MIFQKKQNYKFKHHPHILWFLLLYFFPKHSHKIFKNIILPPSLFYHEIFIMGRIKYQGLHNIMQLTKENWSINVIRACIFELCWLSYLYITYSSILHQPSHFLTPTYCHHCPLQYQYTKKWLQIITLLWFDYMAT
jgi:hypothetical protein